MNEQQSFPIAAPVAKRSKTPWIIAGVAVAIVIPLLCCCAFSVFSYFLVSDLDTIESEQGVGVPELDSGMPQELSQSRLGYDVMDPAFWNDSQWLIGDSEILISADYTFEWAVSDEWINYGNWSVRDATDYMTELTGISLPKDVIVWELTLDITGAKIGDVDASTAIGDPILYWVMFDKHDGPVSALGGSGEPQEVSWKKLQD